MEERILEVVWCEITHFQIHNILKILLYLVLYLILPLRKLVTY